MRIAHFSDTYLPRRDGIVTALHTLTAALDDLGHHNLRVVPRHPDQHDADGLLRVRSLPCGVAQYRMAAWPREPHVARVAAWRPDVIHVHTPGMVGLLGVFAARRLGLPLVHTYHTDLHAYVDAYRVPSRVLSVGIRCYARRLGLRAAPVPRRLPGAQRRRALLDTGNGLLLGGADAVLVPTAAVLARCGLPVLADRIHLVPTGVAPRPVPAGAAGGFRSRHALPADAPLVLSVGRVNREKNIELLVRAFGRLLAGWPPAGPAGSGRSAGSAGSGRSSMPGMPALPVCRAVPRLVLVGAVYERRWLAGLLRDTGVAAATVVTGQLPPEEVAAAYRAAQVFAFPSRTDTQGLVLLEAALAGLPAVLADPQLHGTGPLAGTGLLAPADPAGYAAALAGLLADPDRRAALGAVARERALAHTPDRFAATVVDVYHRAVANRRPSTAWADSRPGAVGLPSSSGRIGWNPAVATGMGVHAGRLVTGQAAGLPPGAGRAR
jgi:1,2-diacylglycerol 3-alpha-glucosyltransferase